MPASALKQCEEFFEHPHDIPETSGKRERKEGEEGEEGEGGRGRERRGKEEEEGGDEGGGRRGEILRLRQVISVETRVASPWSQAQCLFSLRCGSE